MKIQVRKSFEKDVDKIKDKKTAEQLFALIEKLESIRLITDIKHLKKMKAKGNFFRIRIGDFRVGLSLEKETITLLRFMHRKDIYNYFP